MSGNEKLKQVKVKDLPKTITEHKYGEILRFNVVPTNILDLIGEEYYNEMVYVIENRANKKTGAEVVKVMNERFVQKQLNLNFQSTDKRELFYIIRYNLGGKLDIKGDNKQQGRSIDESIKGYCEKLVEPLDLKYWGYVFDYLDITPKETIIVYDTQMNPIMLSNENINEYTKTPFFLIICEKKETIKATMKEMINRGYDKGFYGLALGGTSTTYNIKLLISLGKPKNFYVFVMHDLDLDGIKIFFDMKKYFPCESIGINPEMLDSSGVSFEDGCEDYKPENRSKTLKYLYETIEKSNFTNEIREMYKKWVFMCENKRFELNSLTALRIREAPTLYKTRDFCNYLIAKIEDPERPWNLNRIRPLNKKGDLMDFWTIKTKIPRVSVIPDFILEFDEDIVKDKINEEHKEYLDVLTEIGDVITNNTYNIEEKLENLTGIEKKVIDNIIDKIKEGHPKIFENVDWYDVLQNIYPGKVKKLNNLIKISEKKVRFSNIKKYIKLTRELKNYIGSIKGSLPENEIKGKEKKLRSYIYSNSGRPEAKERIKQYDKGLQRNLRRTIEYKETKNDIVNLEDELKERIVEKDERKEVLNDFKERLETIFEDLIKELEELEENEDLEKND